MSLPKAAPDTTAIITGASSGIGAQIAHGLARRGHGVTLVARNAENLSRVSASIARMGVRVETIQADVGADDGAPTILTQLAKLELVPHILVNNAGSATSGPVHDADLDAELSTIAVDVTAVARLCTALLPGMVRRGTGAVLNVASVGAFQPVPGQASYGASKAFVLSYTHSLAVELRGTGVTATVLCPGPVKTGFGERAGIKNEDAEATLPRFLWKSPRFVAEEAIAGLERGQITVTPGFGNHLAALIGQHTPRAILLPLLGRMTGNSTQRQLS